MFMMSKKEVGVAVDRGFLFVKAKDLVDPIVEQHGLKPRRSAAPFFGIGYEISSAEQHVDLIIRVADWLSEETHDCSMV